jgi:hypothetical protein
MPAMHSKCHYTTSLYIKTVSSRMGKLCCIDIYQYNAACSLLQAQVAGKRHGIFD